jgi:hypothetical protein
MPGKCTEDAALPGDRAGTLQGDGKKIYLLSTK